MHVNGTAISLNVPDVTASAEFAKQHFGFIEQMSGDGFFSLGHESAGVNVIFLRTGLSSFKPAQIAGDAGQGTLFVFVVDDVDAEFDRIAAAGATVVTKPETEPWGERFCQFADSNGLIWQLVTWVGK